MAGPCTFTATALRVDVYDDSRYASPSQSMSNFGESLRRRWIASLVGWIACGICAIVAQAQPAALTEFPVPSPDSAPRGIAAGPDGNLWFTELSTSQVAAITPAGVITEFPLRAGPAAGVFSMARSRWSLRASTFDSGPIGITTGPDGNLWCAAFDALYIGRVTPTGEVTEFGPTHGSPFFITLGADGNLWFTDYGANQIGRMTPSGSFTEFATPTASSGPIGLSRGPDGNVWFVEFASNQIGRVTPSGVITEFPIPTPESGPRAITTGADGNLWFTEEFGNQVGRMTPDGTISEFPIGTDESHPRSIASGPDGSLWFTEFVGNQIGRITLDGTIREYGGLTDASRPIDIAAGPDGALWFTEGVGNRIGRLIPTCLGDCSGDHEVTVDELLTMVSIALGNAPVAACTAGDADGDGTVTIDEILGAVADALGTCGPTAAVLSMDPV